LFVQKEWNEKGTHVELSNKVACQVDENSHLYEIWGLSKPLLTLDEESLYHFNTELLVLLYRLCFLMINSVIPD
jgi:hypothetical protein